MNDNTVENNVTEAQAGAGAAEAAPEKPVRKRASRRVTAPAGEAAAAVTVTTSATEAEAPKAEAAAPAAAEPAAASAAEDPAAEAPKKRVSRARKKPAAEATETVAEQAEAAPEAAEAASAQDPAVEEPVAQAPKKRVTRARKKAAEAPSADAAEAAETAEAAGAAAAAEPAADEAQAAQAPAEEPVKKTRRARVTKAAKAEADAEQNADAADATGDAEVAAEPAADAVVAALEAKLDEAATSAAAPDTASAAEQSTAQGGAEASDSDKPTRTRKRRGQKQDQADSKSGDAKNGDAKSGDVKNADAKSGDAKSSDGNGNGNGNDQHKQHDKGGDTRSSRTRQRDRKRRGQGDDFEPELTEDDVLLPIAGILDVLDNYAFVRTSGYLPGSSDVYVSLGQVKKYGMKRGDAIVGAIRQPREGEQTGRQKYNAIVKVDSINGRTLEENEKRVEFSELAAIYPERQLKLAHGKGIGAEIDAAAPVGFGQRGLLVVPKPARGVEVLSQIAAAVSANAPDAHLMLLLTNAQPEDITHLSRTVNGEVVAASFERPAEDQATVAELGIDRARRLAELGHDVVVLVDSVGDLARAFAQAQPVSARPAHGAIDDFAITQVRRVLGAARNAENAGSLTVLATAAAKTGVAADKQLLRELRTVANCEIRFAQASSAQFSVDAERSRTRGAAALQPTSAA